MELNKKQIFLIILLIMIIFPPVYVGDPILNSYSTGCWEVASYTFVYLVIGGEYNCYSIKDINYQLLILQILILCSVFLFILFKKK
jgi:hypothetical protein